MIYADGSSWRWLRERRVLPPALRGPLRGLRFAIPPGTAHATLVERGEWPGSMITAFLDTPISDAG